MKNKLLRLAELIEEGSDLELTEAFHFDSPHSLNERINLLAGAIKAQQKRSEALWLAAGKKRSPEEKRAEARAALAAFLFAYLTGEAREHEKSAVEALEVLGRQAEAELVRSLARR